MSLSKLYQDTILAHNRAPHAHHALAHATHVAEGLNRSCGDRIEVQLRLDKGRIIEAAFLGEPCAIAMASASILMQWLPHKSIAEFHRLRDLFELELMESTDKSNHALRLNELTAESENTANTNPLQHPDWQALSEVRAFPGRIKCARLPFAAVDAALKHHHHASSES